MLLLVTQALMVPEGHRQIRSSVRLSPPVFEEFACTSLTHCSDPSESLFDTLTTASWEVCKSSRSLQDSVDSSDSWRVHSPCCQSAPASPPQSSSALWPVSSPASRPEETAGKSPSDTHTHILLQLLSIGTKLHSALAYNLQLIQMPADNT